MPIGALSYGVAAAAFLVLLLLLLTSWRGHLKGGLLAIAVATTFLWAVAAAFYAGTGFRQGSIFYQVLEVGRNTAWLLVLLQLLGPLIRGINLPTLNAGIALFSGSLLGLELFSPSFDSAKILADLRMFGHVALAVGGLILIEQLFRNTRPEQRWATKFLYLGIGTLFVYDFFIYADALLFKRIDGNAWQARGFVNAMAAPLIAVAAARNPQWSLDVFVSRRMVMHSASILGAGLYLLAMAGVGYYIRLYGGTWGTALQMAFLFGAGLLLVAMLFSGQLRASLKLFLSRHFFNYKYDYREEWLKFIDTLSTGKPGESPRERAVRALAEILDSTGGQLWTRCDDGHYRLVASLNMGEQAVSTEPGDAALVRFLKLRQWVIELDALNAEPEFYEDVVLPDWLRRLRRAWLVVPLLQADELQGFIVLAKPRAAHPINWEDRDLLRAAGQQLAGYVRLLETTDALIDARQFEAFNRLSAYVVHDLKNVAGQLALVVSNAARHKSNPAFVDDALGTVENATARMNRMLAQLRRATVVAGESSYFTLDEVLREVIQARSARQPAPLLADTDATLALRASRDRCAGVLEHLIQNAQEATAEGGRVEVRLRRDGDMALIEITDDGCGMDERFIRERLFRPFNTTKGNAGMGIGVYESREFISALGGRIDVASRPGAGTTFFLRLPLNPAGVFSQNKDQPIGVSLERIEPEVAHRRG